MLTQLMVQQKANPATGLLHTKYVIICGWFPSCFKMNGLTVLELEWAPVQPLPDTDQLSVAVLVPHQDSNGR